MDLIKDPSKVENKEAIFVEVNRMNKVANFMSLKYPYTTLDVSQLFISEVFRLKAMPKTIGLDMNVGFTNRVWRGENYLYCIRFPC